MHLRSAIINNCSKYVHIVFNKLPHSKSTIETVNDKEAIPMDDFNNKYENENKSGNAGKRDPGRAAGAAAE